MVRLLISVEGHSEYKFVREVVIPHLTKFDVFAEPQNMKGNVSLDRAKNKLNNLLYNFDYVTTLYDFYGFQGKSQDETKQSLEEKIKQDSKQEQQEKIIPYIQMYEFEALLFSDATIMANNLKTSQDWIDKIIDDCNNLEEINNSKETSPSNRIGHEARYIKTQHAPKILQEIGLPKIREKCQGFNTWLTQLENLGE